MLSFGKDHKTTLMFRVSLCKTTKAPSNYESKHPTLDKPLTCHFHPSQVGYVSLSSKKWTHLRAL